MSTLGDLSPSQALRPGRVRPAWGAEAAVTAGLLGALAAAPLVAPAAVLNDLGQAIVLGLFAIGFNIVFKYSGLLSFGHAAFFGCAAYAQAHLMQRFPGVPVPLSVLGAALGSGALGLGLGHICVRRSGAYFSMTTLAIAAFLSTVAYRWTAVTGGTDGFSGFMPPALVILPGREIAAPSIAQLYWLALAILVPVALSAWALLELTPFGNAVELIRQNEDRAAFLGYDTHALKLANYALAATVAGVAGALWALQNGLVSTDSIDLTLSTTVIIMALIGGTSWFWGPLLGSAIYIFGSDRLSALTSHWQLWMGLGFIGLVLGAPGGCAGLVRAAWMRRGRPDA